MNFDEIRSQIAYIGRVTSTAAGRAVPEHSMAKGQQKPKTNNKPKLTAKEKKKKKKEKAASK